MYEKIAKFYDRLGWSQFPLRLWEQMKVFFKHEKFHPSSHLDIGCGTGTLSIELVLEGLHSEGLDFSIDMMNIARENANSKGLDINFHHDDMRKFSLSKKYDFITCTYDAINHLLTIDEWKQTFAQVKTHLNNNGMFIFDCNTQRALKERWNTINVNKDSEGNYLIQKAIHYEDKGISTASFTVFIKEENGLFDSFEDTFTEIAFPSAEVINILREVGFKEIDITDTNFNRIDNPDKEYRNVYICR